MIVPYNKYEQKYVEQTQKAERRRFEHPARPRYGIITDIVKNPQGLFAYIQYNDLPPDDFSVNNSGVPIPLGYTIEEIALNYGDNLIGLSCKVENLGGPNEAGIAYIIDLKASGDLETAMKLSGFNTIFAPAGNGL